VIGEHERRRARPALAAVDRDEVRGAARLTHAARQRAPERHVADRALDADRQAGPIGDRFDEIEHRVDVVERRVRRRRHAVAADRNAADARNLRRHLRGRQQTAKPK
jgi:hypothetical protein